MKAWFCKHLSSLEDTLNSQHSQTCLTLILNLHPIVRVAKSGFSFLYNKSCHPENHETSTKQNSIDFWARPALKADKHKGIATRTIFVQKKKKNKLSRSRFRVTQLVSSSCLGCQQVGECRLTWETGGVSSPSPSAHPSCFFHLPFIITVQNVFISSETNTVWPI